MIPACLRFTIKSAFNTTILGFFTVIGVVLGVITLAGAIGFIFYCIKQIAAITT